MTASIIVPSYNTPLDYFNEMMRSLEQQTCKDFDVIIIDDGSESPVSYSGPLSVRIVRFDDNKGIVAALNQAVQLVDSKFILRMDADDVCLPNRVELTIQYLEANPMIDFGCTGVEIIPNREQLQVFPPIDESSLRAALPFVNPIAHPSSFFRAHVLKDNQYNGHVVGMEDYLLWMRLMKSDYCFGSIQEPLLKYRIHAENWTRTNVASRRKRWTQLMRYVWTEVHRAPLVTNEILDDVSHLLYPENEGRFSWMDFRRRYQSAILYCESLKAAEYRFPPNVDQVKDIGRRAIYQNFDMGAKPCFHRDVVTLVSKLGQFRYFISKRIRA